MKEEQRGNQGKKPTTYSLTLKHGQLHETEMTWAFN